MTSTFAQRVLSKAIEKLGADAVARRLGMRLATLRVYAEGRRPVPDAVLLKIVDELPGLRDD